MNLRKLILTKNECYTRGTKIKPCGVMVHSTAANNPWIKRYVGPDDGVLGKNQYNNHWNVYHPGGKDIGAHSYKDNGKGVCSVCGGRQVCVHGFIGKFADGTIGTYQTLPFDIQGWHAGGSANGKGYIGFEICEDALTDKAYFEAVYKEAAEFTAYICKTYGLDPLKDGVVICHQEGYKRGIASNHADVLHWFPKFGKSMDDFRKYVASLMGTVSAGSTASTPSTPATGSTTPSTGTSGNKTVNYLVRVTVKDLRIRSKAGTDGKINGIIPVGTYTIVEESTGPGAKLWGRLKSGAGWIALDYATKV